MSVKEKLVELLEPYANDLACEQQSGSCELTSCRSCNARNLADHLIANGVTVQEWISVKDRLPEENEIILAWVAACRDLHFCFGCEVAGLEVTHWMPLPEAPKGE